MTRKMAKAALAEPRERNFRSERSEGIYDCGIRYLTHVANYKFPGELCGIELTWELCHSRE